MDKSVVRTSYLIAIITLASLYLFFFRLGSIALTDPDEVFYAQSAKEMLSRSEWTTPYLYGKPQFEKPIFFYWLVEASFKIFGINEFAARLPSAIFGLAGIIATYLLGAALFTRRVGLLSSLMLATSVEYIILARACVTDMVLTVFITFAFLFFIYGYKLRKASCYIVSSAFLALAVLTKGPVGIVLPAVIIGAFLFMKRDLREVLTMPLLGMSFAFLAIALPWYVMMYVVHGKEFIDVFIGFHNIVRFLEPEHKTGAVFYYYVPVLFGGLFPWSPFLPFGIWESFKKASTDKTWGGSSHAFLLVWFLVFFVFFSLASTRLPTYIFPSFAPLALMIGNLWDEALEVEGRGRRVATWMRISHHLLFGSLMAGIIGLYIFLGIRYPELMWGAIFAGTLLAVGISLSFMSSEKKRFLASFLFIVLAVASFLPPLSYAVLPEIERHETSKGIAEKLEGLMKQDERIGCESDYLPGLAFYTGKTPVNIDRHHDLVTFLGSSDRVWCVLKEKNHIELYTLDSKPYYTKPSYVVWRHGKKCIVTNKVPDDGRYLQKRERVR